VKANEVKAKLKRARTSAGLVMFRRTRRGLELLLAHPGGPFFRKKDLGYWTIPKGEAGVGEDLLTRAQIEFHEEVGVPASSQEWIELGWIQQKGGKIVHAWAFESDLPADFVCCSNRFEMEWPPRSGKMQTFPEVDCAEFFPLEKAREKIKPTQLPLLDRLVEELKRRDGDPA
jgi:predicted NUDIX family NTP pyrophosphohydrolase